MRLEDIVPWGRSFEEYVRMFALAGADLDGRILGCGDGPASFNAEARSRGVDVLSVDPLYAFPAAVIAERIEQTRPQIERGLREGRQRYVWTAVGDVDGLIATRLRAMGRFLADYGTPGAAGRYCAAALPALPLRDGAFDLALVSHLLFTYSERIGAAGHVDAVRELLRAAREVRIFPLLTLDGRPSPHLDAVTAVAGQCGWQARIERVDYEFQVGANRMLRLSRRG